MGCTSSDAVLASAFTERQNGSIVVKDEVTSTSLLMKSIPDLLVLLNGSMTCQLLHSYTKFAANSGTTRCLVRWHSLEDTYSSRIGYADTVTCSPWQCQSPAKIPWRPM